MDYVYICREGINEELRYSIRSIIKFAPKGNIWVIGYAPDWYEGNFISVEDKSSKFNNIKECLRVAAETKAISDNFVLMNDDFYFLKKTKNIPNYHGGYLKNKIDEYSELQAIQYSQLLRQTYKDLKKQGIKEPLDYELHVPMVMNKKLLLKSIDLAYFPRSAYGNINNIEGKIFKDVKVYSDNSLLQKRSYDFSQQDIEFISTEDKSFEKVYELYLKNIFKKRSSFER